MNPRFQPGQCRQNRCRFQKRTGAHADAGTVHLNLSSKGRRRALRSLACRSWKETSYSVGIRFRSRSAIFPHRICVIPPNELSGQLIDGLHTNDFPPPAPLNNLMAVEKIDLRRAAPFSSQKNRNPSEPARLLWKACDTSMGGRRSAFKANRVFRLQSLPDSAKPGLAGLRCRLPDGNKPVCLCSGCQVETRDPASPLSFLISKTKRAPGCFRQRSGNSFSPRAILGNRAAERRSVTPFDSPGGCQVPMFRRPRWATETRLRFNWRV